MILSYIGKPQIYLCKQEIANLFRLRLSSPDKYGNQGMLVSAAYILRAFVWKGRNPILCVRSPQAAAQLKFPHLGNSS